MEANKKAKELVDKYLEIIPIEDAEHGVTEQFFNQYCKAKQCAIIAVDEIIIEHHHHGYEERKRFWVKVKTKITNL